MNNINRRDRQLSEIQVAGAKLGSYPNENRHRHEMGSATEVIQQGFRTRLSNF
jgi:hypothetical protein